MRFHRETDHGDFALWLTLAAVPLPHPVNGEYILDESERQAGQLPPWDTDPYSLIHWGDMLKFSAVRYFLLARHLELWAGALKDTDTPVSPDYGDNLRNFKSSCIELGLRLSAKYIEERMLNDFRDGKSPTGRVFCGLVDTLIGRIEDELELTLFLYIPSSRAEFYESVEPLFGEAVSDQFSSAITDIEEAGKCLALGADK